MKVSHKRNILYLVAACVCRVASLLEYGRELLHIRTAERASRSSHEIHHCSVGRHQFTELDR
jgi:hypothetical protein